MKITLIAIGLLASGILVYFFFLGYLSRAGSAPGLSDGKLMTCPDKPNCVCSESGPEGDHWIEPFTLPENARKGILALAATVITEMGGDVQARTEEYVAATFTSSLFRFVDDLELRVDNDKQQIHLRSASRVGHSDLGMNRKRVNLFKQLLHSKLEKGGLS